VGFFMLREDRLLSKLFKACLASIWLYARMYSDVLVQNSLLAEELLTLLIGTLVGLGIRVYSIVLRRRDLIMIMNVYFKCNRTTHLLKV
jgi:hypothetical protein